MVVAVMFLSFFLSRFVGVEGVCVLVSAALVLVASLVCLETD